MPVVINARDDRNYLKAIYCSFGVPDGIFEKCFPSDGADSHTIGGSIRLIV